MKQMAYIVGLMMMVLSFSLQATPAHAADGPMPCCDEARALMADHHAMMQMATPETPAKHCAGKTASTMPDCCQDMLHAPAVAVLDADTLMLATFAHRFTAVPVAVLHPVATHLRTPPPNA